MREYIYTALGRFVSPARARVNYAINICHSWRARCVAAAAAGIYTFLQSHFELLFFSPADDLKNVRTRVREKIVIFQEVNLARAGVAEPFFSLTSRV